MADIVPDVELSPSQPALSVADQDTDLLLVFLSVTARFVVVLPKSS